VTEFLRDVSHRQAHVQQGRLQIGVTHHLLQDRKAHASTGHVSAEGVSKAMSIRHRQHRASSPMPEQAPESCRGHRAPAMLALQHYEEPLLRAFSWPFQLLVLTESVCEYLRKRKCAIALSLSANTNSAVAEDDVAVLELDNLA
jgi:hypothetical protein